MLRPIKDRYAFHQFALNYRGQPFVRDWPIHPNSLEGDPYGVAQLPKLIEAINPQLLLIVFDIRLYYAHKEHLERHRPTLPVILYCPIDGDDADFAFLRRLNSLTYLVLFTRFARRVAEAAAQRSSELDRLPKIAVIPHGNDKQIFQPLIRIGSEWSNIWASRLAARRLLFPDRPDLKSGFIVLNANQNNPRKRIDLTLEGFARFARGKPPSVKLYLHTNLYERGSELIPVARRLGIEERLLFTADGRSSCAASNEELNLIYNACDVGLNTSVGEGWGLVAFEHAATGAAQILPRHSVHEELWGEAADLVQADQAIRTRFDFVTHRMVAPDHIAAALERLYASPTLLRFRSLDAFRRATSPALSWSRPAQRWDHLFRDVLRKR